ncbi:hypothetical protein Hanom_Chr17g01542381 [Helianthus anomalus]
MLSSKTLLTQTSLHSFGHHKYIIYTMSSTSMAWMVAGTVGLVELKDQGFARWNYTIRTIHHHAKSNLRSLSHTKHLHLSSPASTGGKEEKAKQSEESLRNVMYLSCWGS